MEFVFELILRIVFQVLIIGCGIFLRWCLKSFYNLVIGEPLIPLKEYYDRFLEEPDTSNELSNRIINFILGAIVIGSVVLSIIKLVD